MITPSFHPAVGGLELHVEHLAVHLRERGHVVHIMTKPQRNRRPQSDVVSKSILLSTSRYMRAVDVVHVHAARSLYSAAAIFVSSRRRPVVFTPHCFYPPRTLLGRVERKVFDRLIGEPAIRRADRVIALTRAGRHDVISQGAAMSRCEVVPNGVDFRALDALCDSKADDDSLEGYALFTGRIDANKNVEFLVSQISAVSELRLRLIIIGPDGGRLGRIKDLVLNLPSKYRSLVDVRGRVSRTELVRAVRGAAVVILPSYYEGLPTSLLEAASLGVPVIGSRVGGTTELVDGLPAGFGFDLNDPASFQSALAAAIGTKVSERREMARLVRDTFGWDVVTNEVERQYELAISTACQGVSS